MKNQKSFTISEVSEIDMVLPTIIRKARFNVYKKKSKNMRGNWNYG